MRDNGRNIFPDDERIEQEIRSIVAKGIMKPESFMKLLFKMYRQIGIRFIMKDYKEIFISMLLMATIMFVTTGHGQEIMHEDKSYYGIIMVISPLLYGILSLLPFINSKLNGTSEVEMTCKYNLYQIAAFRMLVFSVLCFFINTVWVLTLALKLSTIHFVQAFLISTTSLMLFSLLFLYVLAVLKTLVGKALVMIGWIGIQVCLLLVDSAVYYQLLVSIPWYLYSAIIVLSAYFYVKKIKEYMLVNKRSGVNGLC